jgi:hypothetical protein
VPLVLHPEAEQLIAERTASRWRARARLGRHDLPENRQRLKMGEFPQGATIIPNPFNRIPGFGIREHWFVPGFPVMAWPMIEWVLDTHYAACFHLAPQAERSMLVFETRRVDDRAADGGGRTFSLPSVGDGRDGRPARRHIELGVKGPAELVDSAFAIIEEGVRALALETQRI